jgi:DNA-binding protein
MNSKYLIRKIHRYFGVIIGIQFLLWTVGGLYFAWTNIEEIRGKHLIHQDDILVLKDSVKTPIEILRQNQIPKVSVKEIKLSSLFFETFYEVHTAENMMLINAETGVLRTLITEDEVKLIVNKKLKKDIEILKVDFVTDENISEHFQYRGGMLPAWAVELNDDSKTTIYVCAVRGTVEKVRTKQWRIFDYLWMFHIMDYDERDNINNNILRVFSILGLMTILSGFVLFFKSSKTILKINSKKSA